jgi:hypothetical protein
MNKTELSNILLQAQLLARSDNPLDHVIARELIAKLIPQDEDNQYS